MALPSSQYFERSHLRKRFRLLRRAKFPSHRRGSHGRIVRYLQYRCHIQAAFMNSKMVAGTRYIVDAALIKKLSLLTSKAIICFSTFLLKGMIALMFQKEYFKTKAHWMCIISTRRVMLYAGIILTSWGINNPYWKLLSILTLIKGNIYLVISLSPRWPSSRIVWIKCLTIHLSRMLSAVVTTLFRRLLRKERLWLCNTYTLGTIITEENNLSMMTILEQKSQRRVNIKWRRSQFS